MPAKLESLFPTFLYRAQMPKCRTLNDNLAREVVRWLEKDREGLDWSRKEYEHGYSTFGTKNQLHKTSPVFKELTRRLLPSVRKFVELLNWDIDRQTVAPLHCWANAMGKGAQHPPHNHPMCMISGVYYINSPAGAAPLILEDPRLSMFMAAPERRRTAPKQQQSRYMVQPKAGELVLFESWLRHEVPMHRAEELRLSVAFNFGVV